MLIRRLLAFLCIWLLVCPAWAVNVKQLRVLFWHGNIPVVQPFSSAPITMPASGTTACYSYFAPSSGGCSTGIIGSPIAVAGTVSGLTWTATANATAAGVMQIELMTATPTAYNTYTDTNYGCQLTMVASNVQCICTPKNATACSHAGVTSKALVAGNIYAWKFTVVSGTTNWNTMSTQIGWTIAAPNGGQNGQMVGGSGAGSLGAGAQTSYIAPYGEGGISGTETNVASFEPNLGITITSFTTWNAGITDTTPGHTWTLVHNGSNVSGFTCNTVGATSASRTCTATGSVHIAPFDTFSINVVGTSGSVNILPAAAVSFTPDASGESPIFTQVNTGTSTTAFYNLVGANFAQAQATEATYQGITPAFPNSYTLSGLLFFQNGANSAAHNRTGTLRTSAAFPATPGASGLSCSTPAGTSTGTVGNGGLTGIICQSGASVSMVPSSYADWGLVTTSGSTTSTIRYSAIAVVK